MEIVFQPYLPFNSSGYWNHTYFMFIRFMFGQNALNHEKHEIYQCSRQDQALSAGESHVEESLLEGHLGITKELLAFQTPEKKFQLGSMQGGVNLIKVWATCRCSWHPSSVY